MNHYGFARVTVASPKVCLGYPSGNADAIIDILKQVQDSDVVVFPELCITGYSCKDLFRQQELHLHAIDAVWSLARFSTDRHQLIFVGAPVHVRTGLYNCAVAIYKGQVIGVVPKTHIPNYSEFEESRWFRAADGTEPGSFDFGRCGTVPFGANLLFPAEFGLVVHAEICEDLWMPIPPSSLAALAGANLFVNLSASNETVAKDEYRTQLVANQSGRCLGAYAYASANEGESAADVVFGGHCMIAENGHVIAETFRVGDGTMQTGPRFVTADVDIERLNRERTIQTSFGDSAKLFAQKSYRPARWHVADTIHPDLKRKVNGQPFVPQDAATLNKRAAQIFGIQCAATQRRLKQIDFPDVHIGVSGGLDSTLALLVLAKVFKQCNLDPKKIHGWTLPGFGTTEKTKGNALTLMEHLGISSGTIDIRPNCLQVFKDIRHDPFGVGMFHHSVELDKYGVTEFEDTLKNLAPERKKSDLTFENVQARVRTLLLMSKGFVIGTGDLSELALGWCTYNADHMSMFNPNCSIPKTLVKWLVRHVAETECSYERQEAGESLDVKAGTPGVIYRTYNGLFNCLMSICDTTISPELLPAGSDGNIVQSTEDILGPYELHDFYLPLFVRHGFTPEKILYLSDYAKFSREYPRELREQTLRTFLTRFFSQQFKRDCVPNGPKVGSVSLSPRGDWRMPSDALADAWLNGL